MNAQQSLNASIDNATTEACFATEYIVRELCGAIIFEETDEIVLDLGE